MRADVYSSTLMIVLAVLSLCGHATADPPQRRVRELIEQVETASMPEVLAAIKELTKFKSRAKNAAAPIARHLGSTDAELRAASVVALRAIGKAAMKPVVGVFQEQLEGKGADALGASWDLLKGMDEKRAREKCLEAAVRADLAEAGALALSTLGPFGVECLFHAASRDDNAAVAFFGVQSAAELSAWTSEAAAPLAGILVNDDVRMALTAAVTHSVRVEDVEHYLRWTGGQPASLQLAGIWALGEMGTRSLGSPSSDPLLALLDDENKETRRLALWAIIRIAKINWQPSVGDLREAEAFSPREYPDEPMVRLGAPPIETVRLMLSHKVRRPYLDDDAAIVGLMLSMPGLPDLVQLSLASLDLSKFPGVGQPEDPGAGEAGVRAVWDLGSRWHRSIPSLPPRLVIEPIDATEAQEALAQKALRWATAQDGIVADGMLRVAASLCPTNPDVKNALVSASNDENPNRQRIGFAGVSALKISTDLSTEELSTALTQIRSPELTEALVFAGEASAIDALITEATDPTLLVYPWTWVDVLELEGPTERMQALLKARLKAGDLSMAALVTEFCADPKSALLPLLQSKSSVNRMLGVSCFKQLGDKASAALLRNTQADSPLEREFIKQAIEALK